MQAIPPRTRSHSNLVRAVSLFLLFLGVIVPLGCNSEPPLPPLAPVKGKVTVDGKALTSGNVKLYPVTTDATANASSHGPIDSSGNFEILTAGKPGAPKLKYKVVVTTSTMPTEKGAPPIPFDKKYNDPKLTPLEFEVIDSAADGRYDLKLTK